MILAIVGSVKGYNEHEAIGIIDDAIERYQPEAIVSGGADGIDTLAEVIGKKRGLPVIVCFPAKNGWHWYKARNKLIAQIGNVLIRIAAPSTHTYGSGWTADYAESLDKVVERHTTQ